MGSPAEAATAVHEESLDNLPTVDASQYLGGWKKLDPIPYAGFIPTGSAEHYLKDTQVTAENDVHTSPEEGF